MTGYEPGGGYNTGSHAYPAEPDRRPVAGASVTDAPVTGAPVTDAEVEQTDIGELIGRVGRDLSTLVRQEIELAKAEATEEAKRAGKAAGMFGGAGLAGYMVALFLTVAVMAALWIVLPLALAAFVTAALWGIVGLVLYGRGRRELREVRGLPQTKETVKEDVEWARHPTS